MASRVFKEVPKGLTLEHVQRVYAEAAKRLNENREARDERRFARMWVSDVLFQRGMPPAFYITFTDKDGKAIKVIARTWRHLRAESCCGVPFRVFGFYRIPRPV